MLLADFGTNSPNLDAARQQVMLLTYVYGYLPTSLQALIEPTADIVVWHVEDATWPPSYVLLHTNDDRWFMCIEGTTSINQGIGHMVGTFGRRFIDNTTVVNGLWYGVAQKMMAELAPHLPGAGERIDLRISGHSYGGALAHILGVLYKTQYHVESSVQLMTFGEPRALTAGYVGRMPNPHWRINSTNDIVPLLPPDGIAQVALNWSVPVNFSALTIGWSNYGTEQIIYGNGGLTPESTPVPPPPLVTDVIPDAHYLPNYWGRLDRNLVRFGGAPFAIGDIKRMDYAVVRYPEITITPELPVVVAGPTKASVVPPPVQKGMRAVPQVQPTLAKIVWNFVGQQGETWQEVYYKVADGTIPTREGLLAALPPLDRALVNNRLSFLYTGHTLQSVVASFVSGARLSVPRVYGLSGTSAGSDPADIEGADITASAAIWSVIGVTGLQRKIWFRGFADTALIRSPINGKGYVADPIAGRVAAFITACAAAGYGIVGRVKKPSVQVSLPTGIVSVDGSVNGPYSFVTTAEAHGFADFDQVIIAKCSNKDLPAINAIHSIRTVGLAATVFKIIYTTPSNGIVVTGLGYVRKYERLSLDVFSPSLSAFFSLGVRQTRTPLSRSRGESRARVRKTTA